MQHIIGYTAINGHFHSASTGHGRTRIDQGNNPSSDEVHRIAEHRPHQLAPPKDSAMINLCSATTQCVAITTGTLRRPALPLRCTPSSVSLAAFHAIASDVFGRDHSRDSLTGKVGREQVPRRFTPFTLSGGGNHSTVPRNLVCTPRDLCYHWLKLEMFVIRRSCEMTPPSLDDAPTGPRSPLTSMPDHQPLIGAG